MLGLGEWKVTKDAGATLVCLGLGSCVSLSLYDPGAGVAGMAHMVLPKSPGEDTTGKAAKFVDKAVPLLLSEVARLGASPSRLKVCVAGGSTMMSLTSGSKDVLKIGERNAEAALAALKTAGLKVNDCDLGGVRGRTVRLDVGTGRLTVTLAGAESKEVWAPARSSRLLMEV